MHSLFWFIMNTVTPLFLYVAQLGVYMPQIRENQKSRDALILSQPILWKYHTRALYRSCSICTSFGMPAGWSTHIACLYAMAL